MINKTKYRQKLGPVAEKIKERLPDQSSSSMRSLAEILLSWYERKLAESEANKNGKAANTLS